MASCCGTGVILVPLMAKEGIAWSTTQETHGDVLQGPLFLPMWSSCDVGFVVEVLE